MQLWKNYIKYENIFLNFHYEKYIPIICVHSFYIDPLISVNISVLQTMR